MLYFEDKEFKTSLNLDIYLIIKYWNKHNTNKLNINDIEYILKNKYSLAKAIGKVDIGFFAFYYLQDFFIKNDDNIDIRESSSTHIEVIEELNKMFVQDLYDRELFVLPRGFAKSTIVNKLLSCWLHCYKKSKFTVIIGKTERDTRAFIFDTKKMLQNKRIVESFGVLIDTVNRKVNADEIELANDTMISAKAYNSTIRGTVYNTVRPQVIICDDVLKQDDVNSDDSKQKIVDKYYKEIVESGDKAVFNKAGKKVRQATKFIVLGTPLAAEDFIETISKDATFKSFKRGVVSFDIDQYFMNNKYWLKYRDILLNIKDEENVKHAEAYYKENKDNMTFDTIWNDKYSNTDIANSYFTTRLSFMQELMCDTSCLGEKWITNLSTLEEEDINKFDCSIEILAIDQATNNSKKNDFTAFTVLGKYNNFYIVKQGKLYKFDSILEFEKYIDTVISILLLNKNITHVFLEKNTFKGIDANMIQQKINNIKELKRRKIKIITIYNTKNKDVRISTITDKINSGMVFFNSKNEEYNNQVKQFKGQRYTIHDDAIDSLEMAINNIDNIKHKKKNKIVFLKNI